MNAVAITEAHEAHVAAHGPDCGKGRGRFAETNACVAVYRAWLHLSTGPFLTRRPEDNAAHVRRHRARHPERHADYARTPERRAAEAARLRDLAVHNPEAYARRLARKRAYKAARKAVR